MTVLSWRDAWPDAPLFQPGTHLILDLAREPEPEPIGSVYRYLRAGAVVAWAWSLTSKSSPIVGFRRPDFTASGFDSTQREARDALVAAWRLEEAYRAMGRASPIFDSLPLYAREYVTTGQPVPAKLIRAP